MRNRAVLSAVLCLVGPNFVDIGGTYSSCQVVNCGTPQGSLLGPTLFSLFINDLCNLPFFSTISLYADDTTLHLSGLNLDIISQKVNSDLFLLDRWMQNNGLKINASKSEVLHIRPTKYSITLPDGKITIGFEAIPSKPAIRFLGIRLDSELSGYAYFDHMKKKLVGGVAALSRLSRQLNERTMLLIYHAFFSSHLGYGVESFGLSYKKFTDPIFKLQKRAIRIVANRPSRDHTTPIFVRLKILPYPCFIHYSICVFIFKLLTARIPNIISLSQVC